MRVKAHRTDGNHGQIRDELRALGFLVQDTFQLGGGVADMIVAKNGHMRWVEIKDPAQPRNKRELTPAELRWHQTWGRYALVALTTEDVLAQWPI